MDFGIRSLNKEGKSLDNEVKSLDNEVKSLDNEGTDRGFWDRKSR